jgi:putative membrane protein
MKEIEGLYYKLFSIPRKEVMLTVSFLIAVVLSILDLRLLYLWLLIFAISAFAVKLAQLKFDLKRISFLAAFVTVLSLAAALLKGNLSATSFLLFLVFYFCSERKTVSLLLAPLPYVLLSPTLSNLLILTLSAVLFLIYLKLLSVRLGVVDIRSFVEKFVLFWLTSKSHYIEEFLKSSSKEFYGKVRCLMVNNARIVQTDFHPGPFRNVGGARLVEKLSEGNAVYLHSPTSHERNPVSYEEVEKIASALSCSGKELKAAKPFRVEGEKFEVYCFPFDGLRLFFVSGKRRLDDFIVESESMVVDCHNAYEADYDPDDEDLREIRHLLKEAELRDIEGLDEVKAGFVKIEAETESICGYAGAILLDYGGERYAIVVFDSNNIDLEFRKRVERSFAEIGYKAVVASTDNHAKTGIRAKQSYKPAGRDERDWEVVESLLMACKDAKLEKAVFKYSENGVRVRVMGDRLLQDAEVAVKMRASSLIATFLGFAAINYLFSLTLNLVA